MRPKIKEMLEENDGQLPPYAWPGGYPIVYVDSDNSTLCAECATESINDQDELPNFRPVDWLLYEEGPTIACDHCGKMIDSVYGDPDAYAEISISERRDDGQYSVGNRISCYSEEEYQTSINSVIAGYQITKDESSRGYRHIHMIKGDLIKYISVDFR
jgi:hypothetical protein